MSNPHILQILKILSQTYTSTEKTTLNRMRIKPNAFKILISCLLSLRARDETTEVISKALFKIADTPETLIKIPIKKLEKIIFSTGHYKKKAKILQEVSKELINRFNSKVPKTREQLMSIKGIGPKTANIVLAFAYNELVIPVDTHVHRVSNRLGFVKTKTAEKTELELYKIIPKTHWLDYNAILVQFGREICQPISPWCSKCPINKYCPKLNVKTKR